MNGIVRKRLSTSSSREREAAKISTTAQAQPFLEKYDLVTEPCLVSASSMEILDSEWRLTESRRMSFKDEYMESLHYGLRANFDGFSTSYVPNPPKGT